MKTRLGHIYIILMLLASPIFGQGSDSCAVTGRIFRPDGSPAAGETVHVLKVERQGLPVTFSPFDANADSIGTVTLSVPRNSDVWIEANDVDGLNIAGGVPLVIPDTPQASLELLWHAPDGVTSFNGRAGDVTLTTDDISTALGYQPANPSSIIGTINSSTESQSILDRVLSSNIPRLNSNNTFQLGISAPGISGSVNGGNLSINGNGQGNVGIGSAPSASSRLTISGAPGAGGSALRIDKGVGASSALDIYVHDTVPDKSLRIFTTAQPPENQPQTYFNSRGAFFTNAYMVVSGHTTGTGDAYRIVNPTTDPFMVGIWSDIRGPALQVRGSTGPGSGSYLFSGIDWQGRYTFSIEEDGRLAWGTRDRAGMDTNLYRSAPGALRTDGTLLAAGGFSTLGLLSAGSVSTPDLVNGNSHIRSLVRTLPTAVNSAVDLGTYTLTQGAGMIKLSIIVASTGYSMAKEYALPVQYDQSPANTWLTVLPAAGTKPYFGNNFDLEARVIRSAISLRIRTTAASGNHPGTAYIVLNQEGLSNDAFTASTAASAVTPPSEIYPAAVVSQMGTGVGIGTDAPVDDAAVDINGGDDQGLRLRPRSVPGAPGSGKWSMGTMILDSTGTPFICTRGGTPGTWKRLVLQ